ncbi:PREDICTED: transcription initiation factor TFIID subunit 1-like isoform X2 [Lupinus angustifolius]|uniref:transcription initiation factor TFIID subunit 1-like isoform X2 n=1 Tax=Lupinus angustifolius TaxID=3871 RepID=UPI00092ED59B|nr:PREDICTED: transcription initiation factor TFIID subunit 1-like isoform X2 [Lupinus angustifolius]
MGYDSDNSQDGRDEDDEEEYEENDKGNRFLGFMFGNVDNSGDLDADYLDEDAKEHLSALADKLGPSLTDIDLSGKSPQTPPDIVEQDCGEKAEDAVDYEDIDEQYDGPETEAANEEMYLLPNKEFFSAEASLEVLESRASVFDDENYDEESEQEQDLVNDNSKIDGISLAGEQEENSIDASKGESGQEQDLQVGLPQTEEWDTEIQKLEEGSEVMKRFTPLPVLCVEDGVTILRFSEIFSIHEPLRKGEKRECRHSIPRERYNKSFNFSDDTVEEDEETFLKGFSQSLSLTEQVCVVHNDVSESNYVDLEIPKFGFLHGDAPLAVKDDRQQKDCCLSAEPMKEDIEEDLSQKDDSFIWANFYPLDQQDWEDEILWGNSPAAGDNIVESCEISGPELGDSGGNKVEIESEKNLQFEPQKMMWEKDHNVFTCGSSPLLEPFGSRDPLGSKTNLLSESLFHPQLLRLESRSQEDSSCPEDGRGGNISEKHNQIGQVKRFTKIFSQNREMIEGSWLDKVIWEELHEPTVKPKLIFDLQDDQMHFEVLDSKDCKHLRLQAGAIILTRFLKSSSGDSSEIAGHGGQHGWRNVANDKHYSNRKTSQQLKSNSKKHSAHGIKVFHSQPALKLQTMKLKLSNKDIANFHRPKALWYPHDNEVVVKEQGKLSTQGPMKIILKSLGGQGCKQHVDAEETLSSVIEKVSKKIDFKASETFKIYYLGRELEGNKSFAAQNVQPNSLLHLVRTKIHLWPRAQRVPGENKSLCPPGAFKKKSDLSVKDGHVFLMEYCEERPLLLSNVGMGARLCTYNQKCSPDNQSGSLVRNTNSSLGHTISLDPADKSPFLGDLKPGCNQSSLETNMYRAPIFPHNVPLTDYLLVRSSKGKLSLRRIDKLNVVGQQEPLMEVLSPGSKNLQTYMMNRLLVHMCREFQVAEKRHLPPYIRTDEFLSHFPYLSEASLRKRIKEYAYLQRGTSGQSILVKKRNFRMWSEDELRKMVTPELVCAYESMQAGLYRLKHLGITETHPTHISSAMSRLPDEAIALAAASHIERELQITPWNLSSNFVACTSQGKENIERMEITGVGDPSGRGMGFSYARAPPKAPVSSAMVKRKAPTNRGGSTVTGTDADLRRLSMEAAREVLLKFNVPGEVISKQTRWHRIAMIRKLSSEQAASGVKVDPTTISKYARGQRMSFLQLQQQTREKCQEIWDRQIQCLSDINGDENESDSEGNSDLDSFAGDLENLLDAEECEEGEEGTNDSKRDMGDGVKGLKMRRRPTLAQAEEEIEDEATEASELCRLLMDDDEADRKKKKKARVVVEEARLVPKLQSKFIFDNTEKYNQIKNTLQVDGINHWKGDTITDLGEGGKFSARKSTSVKVNKAKKNGIPPISLSNKKIKLNMGEPIKNQVFKEKKPSRETFVCGACGQLGHMRTNKHCPKYGEDLEAQLESTDMEKSSGKVDPSSHSQRKALFKKSISNSATRIAPVDNSTKIPVKFKCSSTEKSCDKPAIETLQSSDKPVTSDSETAKPAKVNKIIFPKIVKPDDTQAESLTPAIVIRPPTDSGRGQIDPHKLPIKIRQPPAEVDRERSHKKKIIIKRSKEDYYKNDQDLDSPGGNTGFEHRKTKRIVELSNLEMHRNQKTMYSTEGLVKWKGKEDRRWWEEQEKQKNEARLREEWARRHHKEFKMPKEQKLDEIRRYEEDIRMEREEEERQKAKKKKKKKLELGDEYLDGPRTRHDKRMLERSGKRRHAELGKGGADYMQPIKRRRGGGGEVGLANILESIVDTIVKDRNDLCYLFLKPVSKKVAPDYLDIIERPMDLSRIRERARNMEYKSREDFRHDMWQITYNAHKYNNGRNPGIPPIADMLLEHCDYLLNENDDNLTAAEAGIQISDF